MTGSGNVMTQLGMRVWMKGKPENGVADSFRPYIEANWIHHTRDFGVKMNGEGSTMIGSRNLAEARIGAEGEVNSRRRFGPTWVSGQAKTSIATRAVRWASSSSSDNAF